MNKLSKTFDQNQIVPVDLEVPKLALQAMRVFSDVSGTDNLCIGGGFARGLYMQQHLGASPKMNDIDVFADLSIERFEAIRSHIEELFGEYIRFHVGRFEEEDHRRGIIEFALPEQFIEECAGVQSIQFNFGRSHPWADSVDYIAEANLGINQIAVDVSGQAHASKLFVSDMLNKTMTMNPDLEWNAYDWGRTADFMDRVKIVRPEFEGWKSVLVAEPEASVKGRFWSHYSENRPEPDVG